MTTSELEHKVTEDTVREFVQASRQAHEGYAHAAGYLESMVRELILQLPRAKRSLYRSQLKNDSVRMQRA